MFCFIFPISGDKDRWDGGVLSMSEGHSEVIRLTEQLQWHQLLQTEHAHRVCWVLLQVPTQRQPLLPKEGTHNINYIFLRNYYSSNLLHHQFLQQDHVCVFTCCLWFTWCTYWSSYRFLELKLIDVLLSFTVIVLCEMFCNSFVYISRPWLPNRHYRLRTEQQFHS